MVDSICGIIDSDCGIVESDFGNISSAYASLATFYRIPNLACTSRGGYCSVSDTCSSLGGHVEKLSARCKCGNPCCKCTDTCPVGSTCMSEGDTCDGTKDTNGCCGNRFCCTPPVTTTPALCEPNLACTGLGGNCSDSDTCPSLGDKWKCCLQGASAERHVVNVLVNTCPVGSTCMSEGDTCDGTKDTNRCCGNKFCCTPPMTTTPAPCVRTCDICLTVCDGDFYGIEGECCGPKTCCL
ncbi:unnamed protein product [Mytilus edulis]|uniref:Uncharacterized protein n=1 Tax=Mytilus edulis TaxID=6550 RepID=A0A8S3UUG0_MYTED|nr:unnamed protein product [Mytilus edulis]